MIKGGICREERLRIETRINVLRTGIRKFPAHKQIMQLESEGPRYRLTRNATQQTEDAQYAGWHVRQAAF